MDRAGVGQINCRPTPILPAIFKRIVVNNLIRASNQGEKENCQQAELAAGTARKTPFLHIDRIIYIKMSANARSQNVVNIGDTA